MNDTLIGLIELSNPWLSDPSHPIIDEKPLIARAQILIQNEKCYKNLLYLNCDHAEIRAWLKTPLFINQVKQYFKVDQPTDSAEEPLF